jgi:hypothetical protein
MKSLMMNELSNQESSVSPTSPVTGSTATIEKVAQSGIGKSYSSKRNPKARFLLILFSN